MPGREPTFGDQQISGHWLQDVGRKAIAASRLTLTGPDGSKVTKLATGTHISVPRTIDGFWAKLGEPSDHPLQTPGTYRYTEQVRYLDAFGRIAWMDKPFGRSSYEYEDIDFNVAVLDGAHEVNGQKDLVGTFVWLTQGYKNRFQDVETLEWWDDQEWLFAVKNEQPEVVKIFSPPGSSTTNNQPGQLIPTYKSSPYHLGQVSRWSVDDGEMVESETVWIKFVDSMGVGAPETPAFQRDHYGPARKIGTDSWYGMTLPVYELRSHTDWFCGILEAELKAGKKVRVRLWARWLEKWRDTQLSVDAWDWFLNKDETVEKKTKVGLMRYGRYWVIMNAACIKDNVQQPYSQGTMASGMGGGSTGLGGSLGADENGDLDLGNNNDMGSSSGATPNDGDIAGGKPIGGDRSPVGIA